MLMRKRQNMMPLIVIRATADSARGYYNKWQRIQRRLSDQQL